MSSLRLMFLIGATSCCLNHDRILSKDKTVSWMKVNYKFLSYKHPLIFSSLSRMYFLWWILVQFYFGLVPKLSGAQVLYRSTSRGQLLLDEDVNICVLKIIIMSVNLLPLKSSKSQTKWRMWKVAPRSTAGTWPVMIRAIRPHEMFIMQQKWRMTEIKLFNQRQKGKKLETHCLIHSVFVFLLIIY